MRYFSVQWQKIWTYLHSRVSMDCKKGVKDYKNACEISGEIRVPFWKLLAQT